MSELTHTHEQLLAETLAKLLGEHWGAADAVRAKVTQFYQLVLSENQVQNLTRLSSPMEFFEGHLCDVLEFLNLPEIVYPAMDLGSGMGVPGLLASLISPQAWVLVESETRKAEFLRRTVGHFHLNSQVSVFSGRAESYFRLENAVNVQTIVSRAVGSLERLYGWIRKCSTWNKIILFKGPKWEEEWKSFQSTRFGSELKLIEDRSYTIGMPAKQRRLVILVRIVPRGTMSADSV